MKYENKEILLDGYMGVTTADVLNWYMEPDKTARDGDGKEHGVWIVTKLFCGMRFVKDATYFKRDTSLPIRGIHT